ncbi:MAG: Fe(2+)-trafficking protein [Planctomycetota bacterium]|nr:Fe(2+)-trafficking protein [Planctomycetota bacterium]
MATLDDRITQFETMAEADPENDMAHFSLGNAYLQAERFDQASLSLQKCIDLNPDMSKAYQLCGEAMINAGQGEAAVELLNKGYEIAASKGDLMPRNAMGELLKSQGHEPPQLSDETKDAAAKLEESGAFVCQRTGRPGTQLQESPMRGPIGDWIQQNISAQTWKDWIDQGTKVINELRLDFSREEDQHTFDLQMYDFLGIDPDKITREKVES